MVLSLVILLPYEITGLSALLSGIGKRSGINNSAAFTITYGRSVGMAEKSNIASPAFGFLSENFRRYAHTVEMTVCDEDLVSEYGLFKFPGKTSEIVAVSGNEIYGNPYPASDIVFAAFDITAMDKA